ncbi:hypothetical protein PVV74_17520 [Roseovarius sp. SK2]|nr:hypothetical protein [Roseovarius sp. SK2]
MRIAAHNSKTLTTQEILEATAARPLHLRPREELADVYVSSESRWSDRRWVFNNATPGARANQSTITWDLDLTDGTNLCDHQYSDLLDWLKRLVWSAYAAPGDGAAGRLKSGGLGTISASLRSFVVWCVEHYVIWPSQITRVVVEAYVDCLREQANDEGEEESLTANVARSRLRSIALIWQQRNALERAGVAPMPEAPFGRRGLLSVAKEIGAISAGSYRPVPSEVGLPILNTSMKMLGTPAEDVIRLRDLCADAYASAELENVSPDRRRYIGFRRQRTAALNFLFSEVDGAPWHPPLNRNGWDHSFVDSLGEALVTYLDRCDDLPTYSNQSHEHIDTRKIVLSMGYQAGTEFYVTACPKMSAKVSEVARRAGLRFSPIGSMSRVRQLVKAVMSAAQTVIQGTVGFRISEVCGLKAGVDADTGLPYCVRVRDTLTGLAEVFVVTTELSKTEETPRAEEWTIGYRPKGSDHMPPAVQAILVVDRLLAPYRELLETDDLFVNLVSRSGLPKTASGVARVTGETLTSAMRDFVAEWVDLSGLPDEAARKTMDSELVPWRESHGRILKSHQWRKSFAHFAYMVDPSMLPVLQAHFHHVSIAMTDGGYLNHVVQLGDVNDIKRQKVAMLALEIASGGSELAGRNGEDLEKKILNELGPEIAGSSTEDAYRTAFLYVEEAGLHRMFFEPYGICGARSASEMECHKAARTESLARWRPDLTPNYSTRTPGLCAGCPSFAIARWHLPFWEDRYVESVFAVRQYEVLKMDMTHMDRANELMHAQARQAAALCWKLGAHIDALDKRVEEQLKELRDGS